MKAGAVDVLEKPFDDAALLTAIERAVQRTRAGRTEYAQRLNLERRFTSLPARQREVFALITAGLLNKQVAAELGISERTVKVHRERLRRKMGADSVAELSRMAEPPPDPPSSCTIYPSELIHHRNEYLAHCALRDARACCSCASGV